MPLDCLRKPSTALSLMLLIATCWQFCEPGADAVSSAGGHVLTSVGSRRVRRQSVPAWTFLADIVNMLGPRKKVDLVTVFDRSINVGKNELYYRNRPLVEALLTRYATVDPRYVRTAAVTFAGSALVAYDDISNGSTRTKCELFAKDGNGQAPVWNNIVYVDDELERYGRNITAALRYTTNILNAGRVARTTDIQVQHNVD